MSARHRHGSLRALAWWLPLMAVLALLSAAETILSHGLGLAVVIVLLPLAGYGAGHWRGTRTPGNPQDRADLVRLRGLVADLESAAGRPAEAILASYRAIQRRYGGSR